MRMPSLSYYNGARPEFCTNLQKFAAGTNEITTRCTWVTSTGISIVSLLNEGFPTFCLWLTTGRHLGFTIIVRLWFYREITESAKQTVVRELLLEQCCDGLFAIVSVSCMRL